MKLRIRDNSIRLRLTRSEVDTCGRGLAVVASTAFGPDATLQYSLIPADVDELSARVDDQGIAILLPHALASAWAVTGQVSITGEQRVHGGVLHLLIEKDFACLSPREGDDDNDTFAHPQQGQSAC